MKKVLSIVLAAMMLLTMSRTAFAAEANTRTRTAILYKDGTYGTEEQEESMGNGAVIDATVETLSSGKYAIIVNFKSSFTAYGISGYLKNVTIDGYTAVAAPEDDEAKAALSSGMYYLTKSGSAVVGVTYILGSAPTYPQKLDMNFTINVLIMPVSAL